MDATANHLMLILAEWRRLTECEAQAILSHDWKNVVERQQRKARLREEITRARELAGGGDEDKLSAVVTELVARETRDRDVLKPLNSFIHRLDNRRGTRLPHAGLTPRADLLRCQP